MIDYKQENITREEDLINDIDNLAVFDTLVKARSVLARHNKIVVSISGGSDSDIVMDIVERTKEGKNVEYIWFDTGIEYQATKNHLLYLESKYGVEIHRIKAIKPIPTCCREYGVPFISKQVSENISRLQKTILILKMERMKNCVKNIPAVFLRLNGGATERWR